MSDIISIKVVLVGNTGVGKTSIISRFVNDSFSINHLTTITPAYYSKTLSFDNEKKTIKYNIWDTAGQEKYRSMNKINYRNALVAILVYDITDENSFEDIKNYWYSEVKNNIDKDALIAIVANKNDLYLEEKVSIKELSEYAQSIKAIYKQTNCMNNIGINELFEEIGKYIITHDLSDKVIMKKKSTKESLKLSESYISDNNSEISNQNDSLIIKTNMANKSYKKKKNCC